MWHDTKEGLGLGSYWPLFVAGMLLDSHCCGGGYVFSPADLSFLISFLVLGCRLIPVTSGHKDGTFRGRHIWHWLIWTSQVCVIASMTFFVAAMLLPSLHSPLPSEAVRSYRLDLHKVRVMEPRAIEARATEARVVEARASLNSLPLPLPVFRKAPPFRNGWKCREEPSSGSLCSPTYIHIAMTLDEAYLRGSIAAVLSILRHASCPESLFFHFLVSRHYLDLKSLVRSTFPSLKFSVYHFDESLVKHRISPSVRDALTQPLNYARNYLSDILGSCIHRVIYLDSDLVVVDDISKLWSINLGTNAVGAPEYCHANFTKYFTPAFWSDPVLSRTFHGRRPCYFNTGVMVLDLDSWRKNRFSKAIEHWMEVQKEQRIYELGSLPPFLLVFAGNVSHVEHRWNQHGLGGDNGKAGSCRPLHPGPVSLLHWSGTGKPWHRRDSGQPCPLDSLWAPYDLHLTSH